MTQQGQQISPPTFTGSTTAKNLADLTATMGVSNVIGSSEEARRGGPPRVVWVPPEEPQETLEEADQQPPDGHTPYIAHETYTVHCWGADFTGAQALRNQLVIALFNTFSPNAYRLGRAMYVGDDAPGSSGGWAYILPVTVLVPIYSEVWRRAKIAPVPPVGTVTSPLGSEPEEIP